jgi:hypothetical protein
LNGVRPLTLRVEFSMMVGGRSRCIAIGALAVALTLVASTPSSAGFFDFLFGRSHTPAPAPEAPPSAADAPQEYGRSPRISGGLGSPASYCVRLCDGRYFPIQRTATAPATQVCSTLCPAATTKVFFGSDVARATAGDGSRYEDLPNAFVYREKTVDGCSCNGRTPYGLASIDVRDDPTLRPGDLIATTEGLVRSMGARQVYGQAGEDVTSSLGLRGQLDAPVAPPRRRYGRSDYYSRHNATQ